MTEIERRLAELGTLATEVAEATQAHEAAITAERAAEAALLERVIALVKPALPSLVSRLVAHSYETSGRNGCNPVHRYAYHEPRGVVLVDAYDKEKDETGNRGALGGWRVVLLADGTLAKVEREGSFSHWQGEPDEWESTLTGLTVEEAVGLVDVEAVVEGLGEALRKQRASRPEATARAEGRRRTLEALAALLAK